jgi:hypothetical protein
MTFSQKGYEVVQNAISQESAKILDQTFQILRNCMFHVTEISPANLFAFGDEQIPQSFARHGYPCFEALMLVMQPVMEKITGLRLLPTYTYARIYYEGAELKRHSDRPSCQISTTMTLATDGTEWPIFMQNLQGETNKLNLGIGDMCIYRGCELDHWREPYTGQRQTQVFMHYVDADGPHAEWQFDKRAMLGLPPKN